MKKISIKRIIYILTGGRPMLRGKPAVIDIVSRRAMYTCVDKLGRKWLAENEWSWKRYNDDGA